MSLDLNDLEIFTNHPVHVKEDVRFFPTALIPFCEIGGSFSAMGVKIDQFDIPFCNSFQAKIVGSQQCYTVDPNTYKKFIDANDVFSIALYLSFNEDRIFSTVNFDDDFLDNQNMIIIESIGMVFKIAL